MTPAHYKANIEIFGINERITEIEKELTELYAKRAGRILWNFDDSVSEAWCCCCGRTNVFPNDGQDTCPECVKNI